AGRGELREQKRVEVRFVNPAGRPIPSARIDLAGARSEEPLGTADANGVFAGPVVDSIVRCQPGKATASPEIVISKDAASKTVPVKDLRGDVVIGVAEASGAKAK